MVSTGIASTDPAAILNSVCNEGWELVNGSFVFHELGSESRDKFLASGQDIAVKGTVIGYYVFRRCEENKRSDEAVAEPSTQGWALTTRVPRPRDKCLAGTLSDREMT
jgi:hypothetical protein